VPLSVAVAVGDALVGGGLCGDVEEAGALVVVCTGVLPVAVPLGDTDCRTLVVGLADLDAVDVCVPVTRLVPGAVLPTGVAVTEAVAGTVAVVAD
jgi:hypothetical protein